jgi:hypothetical protein
MLATLDINDGPRRLPGEAERIVAGAMALKSPQLRLTLLAAWSFWRTMVVDLH